MGMFDFLEHKITTLVISILVIINLIIVSILFYLIVPLISPHVSTDYANKVVEQLVQKSSADGIFFFGVNLEANSRKVLAFRVKKESDLVKATTYINVASAMRFTTALSPDIVKSLLNGDSICYPVITAGIMGISSVGDILKGYPKASACVIPMKSSTGILNSYVLLVWKGGIMTEEHNSAISLVEGILANKF